MISKIFTNSRPSASNFQVFDHLEQFFLSLYQNNFGNKIEFQIYIFFPGVENLRGAGMIAGETSQSYNEVNHNIYILGVSPNLRSQWRLA